MIKTIQYMSILRADATITSKSDDRKIALISIRDSDTPWNFPYFMLDQREYIKLEFHDVDKQVEPPFDPMILFDHDMANKIYDFVERIEASDTEYELVIHCSGGISRSAAVYMQICAKYGIPYNQNYSLYNKLVFRIMEQVYNTRKYGDSNDYTHSTEIEAKENTKVQGTEGILG